MQAQSSRVVLNLVVLRSNEIERSVMLYKTLGLEFSRHSHRNGPEHYSAEGDSLVFEIYPASAKAGPSAGARVGFSISNLDSIFESLIALGAESISSPKDSEWGRRAVVKDFDGHSIELIEAPLDLKD